MTHTLAHVLEAAVRSSGSVLFVSQVADLRGRGLVALASDASDPCIDLARALAARTGETLKIVQLPASGGRSHAGARPVEAELETLDAIGPWHKGSFLEPGQILKLLSAVQRTPILLLEPGWPVESPG